MFMDLVSTTETSRTEVWSICSLNNMARASEIPAGIVPSSGNFAIVY